VAEGLNVREVEEAVRVRTGGSSDTAADDAPEPGTKPTPDVASRRLRPPGLLELEGLLSDRLDTRVKVSMGAKRGKVTIDFASLEDLERIYRAMTSAPDAPAS
jgi:ParB family chromosome partitioning protein